MKWFSKYKDHYSGEAGVTLSLFIVVLSLYTTVAVGSVHTIEKQFNLEEKGTASIQGNIAPDTEESWSFTIKQGKQLRIKLLKGQHMVVYDVYDSSNMTANEGVDEEDWFPVSAGRYKITVNNISGLRDKSKTKEVTYEFQIELK